MQRRKIKKNSVAGNRTRVSWVKARYPNRWTTTDLWSVTVKETLTFNTVQTLYSNLELPNRLTGCKKYGSSLFASTLPDPDHPTFVCIPSQVL